MLNGHGIFPPQEDGGQFYLAMKDFKFSFTPEGGSQMG